MYVCHDFIDLLCYTLFYLFSQQKQVHVTIIHIKSTINIILSEPQQFMIKLFAEYGLLRHALNYVIS